MKASEALAYLLSDASESLADHVLWRAPGGATYILSPPGADAEYFTQGFKRFETVFEMRKQIQGESQRVLLLILKADVEREMGKGL